MSDEQRPDEQPDHPAHDEQPASGHAPDEPTQPLAGWSPRSTPLPGAQPDPQPESQPDPQPGSSFQPDGEAYGMVSGPPSPSGLPPASPFSQSPSSQPRPAEQAAPTVPFAPGGPGPAYFGPGPVPGPGPYAQPGFGRPAPGSPTRKFPLWTWPAVASLALVVGVLGGLAGGALQDELSTQRGTVDNGLEGVRTQTAAPLAADNGSVAAVAQALLPSTVQIVADLDGRSGGATGSGFVLDREGHVVTNNHVVASAAADDGTIVVIDHRGERHEATVVGRSAVYDLAVLDVDGAESLEPAALGASQVLHVGDSVIAFGAPLGLSQTVTSGIVSALNRPVTTSGESDDESSYINAVQTDAAINPGNSGGPLVNLAGEVVGVNSAIATTGGATSESGNIGVGFAIPIEQVRTTVDQILRTGRAEYPVIGAQVRTGGESDATGATITEVMADTPAERAGLQKDDVITAVDDLPVGDGIALIVAIRTHLPGETVEMSVVRGGKEQLVEVELDGKVG